MTSEALAQDYATAIVCIVCPLLGLLFSAWYAYQTSKIKLNPDKRSGALLAVNNDMDNKESASIYSVYSAIYEGAHSFLYAEYRYIMIFMLIFSLIIFIVLGVTNSFIDSTFTVIAFIVGSLTSVLSGYIGMKIGVYSNARVALKSQSSLSDGFICAFKSASVMGFTLCSFGILNIYVLIMIFRAIYYKNSMNNGNRDETVRLFEAIAGYGLGGSSIALFGRVGGGIYTKAADVGADLVGKVEAGIPEDDPRNPAVIADNVGDNVGDIAGMGADLFGSFAESTCAALVIASQTSQVIKINSPNYDSSVWTHWSVISYPLIISSFGLIISMLTTFYCTYFRPASRLDDIESTLKRGLLISTVLMTPVLFIVSYLWLPYSIDSIGGVNNVLYWEIFLCGASGLWCGLIIGYITEYYTSNSYKPVQDVAKSCRTGAATNIIFGLSLGYKSVIIPAISLSLACYVSLSLSGFYGISIAALGILSTLSFCLTIDAFGPISDNAGGIAEMCEMGDNIRERTDALDAAGNTTAAIGKGFAIASAAFVSLALISGFITVIKNRDHNDTKFNNINILSSFPFSGLLIGAMLPYWFTAMTMKSVGTAALEMVEEVRRQFRSDDGILNGTSKPDYDRCIRISTTASLKEMFYPGALVMFTPLIIGFLFGVTMLSGVLIGSLISGVQMAISQSNTGGAWDNAKKYIEQGSLGDGNGKGSDSHVAAVIGDTVGDPLKDTSGPSLNILIKLMAIISLVFAKSFPLNDGGLFGKLYQAIRK